MRKMHHFVSNYLFISCILLHQCNTKPLPHKKQHYCTRILQIQCYSLTMTKTCSTLGECNSIQCSMHQYFERHYCRAAVIFWQHGSICVQRRWIKRWQQNIIFLAAEYNMCGGENFLKVWTLWNCVGVIESLFCICMHIVSVSVLIPFCFCNCV